MSVDPALYLQITVGVEYDEDCSVLEPSTASLASLQHTTPDTSHLEHNEQNEQNTVDTTSNELDASACENTLPEDVGNLTLKVGNIIFNRLLKFSRLQICTQNPAGNQNTVYTIARIGCLPDGSDRY